MSFPKILKKITIVKDLESFKKFNFLIYSFLIIVFFSIFIISTNLIKKKGEINDQNLKLVLTGTEKLPYKSKWIKNLGLVSKIKYIELLKNSICLAVPSKEGYGTRVKIIEALCHGTVVVSSKIGIEGIQFDKNVKPPFNCESDKNFVETIIKVMKNKKYKKIAKKNSINLIKYYSASYQNSIFFSKII